MQLPRDDQQWAHIPITGLPNGVVPTAKVGTNPWTTMTTDGTGQWKILLRGPDYTTDTTGLLVTGTTNIRVRATSSPESASVTAGTIYLTT